MRSDAVEFWDENKRTVIDSEGWDDGSPLLHVALTVNDIEAIEDALRYRFIHIKKDRTQELHALRSLMHEDDNDKS